MKFLEEYLKQDTIKLLSGYFKAKTQEKSNSNIKQVDFLKEYAKTIAQQVNDNNEFLYQRGVK